MPSSLDVKSFIYDICGVNPCQLAPIVGTLGIEIMNSTASSPSTKSNSKIDGNQIAFEVVDFQPHPPTLASIFASLDQEMDLTIGSFNFCIGSLGSVCLSHTMNSGSWAGKTATAIASKISVGSSSEVNSSVSVKPTKGSIVKELDEISFGKHRLAHPVR
jgi:hypothetical protein